MTRQWVAGLLLLGLAGIPAGPGARRHMIEIRGMVFEPARIEVAVGDTVAWINHDIVPHTATATEPGRWDSGQLTIGAGYSWVAKARGTEKYRCLLHPTMEGVVEVR